MTQTDKSRQRSELSETIEDLHAENQRLRRAVEEVDALFKIALALGSGIGFAGVMRGLIDMTVQALNSEDGVVTLVRHGGDNGETLVRAHASTTDSPQFDIADFLVGWMARNESPLLSNNPAKSEEFRGWKRDERIRSLLCVPLEADNQLIGVLTVLNKRSASGFSSDDVRFLSIIASMSAPRLEAARLTAEKETILRVFGPHISPTVADLLISRGGDVVSERKDVCTMFVDVRGYSTFAEDREPEAVVNYLNALFSFMLPIVVDHHGLVHQLLGDGFMAIFGAPISFGNDTDNALSAALEIHGRVHDESRAGTIPPTRLSIGLHTGTVIAGIVGSRDRKEYKVTGDAVNVAARVERANRQFDSDILITEAVWNRLDLDRVSAESLGSVTLPGRSAPVNLYRVFV